MVKNKIGAGIHRGVCFRCGKKISSSSHHLKLVTLDKGSITEEVWFCMPSCWQEFNQEKVTERLQQIAQIGLKGLVAMKSQYA